MNRSQRCAAVIKGSIAAAVLCGGVGLAAIAPAGADVGRYDDGPGVNDRAAPGRPGKPVVADSGAGDLERTRRGLRSPPPASDDPDRHPRPDWPCHIKWLVLPVVPPLPYTGNRNGIIVDAGTAQASIAVLGGVADTGEHASTALDGSAPEAAEAAPPPAAEPTAGEPAGVAGAPLAMPELPPPAAPPPPSPTSPPPQPTESVAAPVDSDPTGLPNSLQQANLSRIAVTALPGLAGIAALTALGGFLGYRQAKAGYVLRAAGTARFLR